jgi:hypothetical protein
MNIVMKEFEAVAGEIAGLVDEWYNRLVLLPEDVISIPRNKQNRTIKQILGHLIDSATNNTHRVVHLQYDEIPSKFPDYANLGNNDRWIAIQNYQGENWQTIVNLWKYSNLHFIHVVENTNPESLENAWISALGTQISLKSMVVDYPRHLRLHLNEIEELVG